MECGQSPQRSCWQRKPRKMDAAAVVHGAATKKRQQQMDRVSYDRCVHCGKEGIVYHRLWECDAHKRMRLELPRDISKHQLQAVTSKSIVSERRLTARLFENNRLRVGGYRT